MGRSLLDLFKGSSYDTIKQETETLIEQETTGIRIKSAVELNNPLIYGNEAGRIALRTTQTLDAMKSANAGDVGSGGLLDKGISSITGGRISSISQARDKINTVLGIPLPLIPTRVADELETGKSVQDVLDGKNGTELGKFLKQSGGGTPKTIVTQLLGNTIKLGKDKLRSVVFGSGVQIATANPKTSDTFEYTDTNTYSNVKNELRYKDAILSKDTFREDTYVQFEHIRNIDLAEHSPVYGVTRKDPLWTTDLGHQIRKHQNEDASDTTSLSKYSPEIKYTGNIGESIENTINERSLENKYKLTNKSDYLNEISPDIEYTEQLQKELEGIDLIPFWIGLVGANTPKTHFRALLSGISETVTPSWNSDNFFGNPFAFHTYSNIERSVTFSLQIYCMSEIELINNWKRISKLTGYAYPIIEDKLINPPIIQFRLGDIYVGKIGLIDSLSYTFPDNATWETDPETGLLPKFIEVSISIKFIELTDMGIKNSIFYNNPTGSISSTSDDTIDENPRTSFTPEETAQQKGVQLTSIPISNTLF